MDMTMKRRSVKDCDSGWFIIRTSCPLPQVYLIRCFWICLYFYFQVICFHYIGRLM